MRIFRAIFQFIAAFIKRITFSSSKSTHQHRKRLTTPSNDLIKAKVIQVLDGDTVVVAHGDAHLCIRLSAIDCPEGDQPWGDIAKAGLIKLIGGRYIYLETYGADAYDRTVATVYVYRDARLINVNERMVVLGHAWVMRVYYTHLSTPRQIQLNRLESWAQSKKVGLWKTQNPIPPWQWRNKRSA